MPLNIDWQQILLHWMNLAILTGGLYVLLYKPVKEFIAKRIMSESRRELKELTARAAKKLAAHPEADPFDQFLDLAEGGRAHEEQ